MAAPCEETLDGWGFRKEILIAYSLWNDRGFSELWKELPITYSLFGDRGSNGLWKELPIIKSLWDDRGFWKELPITLNLLGDRTIERNCDKKILNWKG